MADPDYVFPGVPQFFEAAAAEHGLLCRDTLNKTRKGWFHDRIVENLSQMGGVAAKVRSRHLTPDVLDEHVVQLRELQRGLRVQSAALDAAIAHALAGYGLADPTPTATTDTPNAKEAKRAAKQR